MIKITSDKSNKINSQSSFIKRRSERGNIFFALFGAVAIVGVLGAGIMSTMRGPLSTMVNVNNKTRAESEMSIASKLILLESINDGFDGDCDADNFIEPPAYDTNIPALTGGGTLPATVGTNRQDPWGTDYGYCGWDSGGTSGQCAGSRPELLNGDGAALTNYSIIAVISAGPDRVFQASCADHPGMVTKGGDDIVVQYDYQGAAAATDGLWNIKTGDATTAEITKNLEVTGAGNFTGTLNVDDLSTFGAGIDMSGTANSLLTLGAASMLFPTDTDLPDADCDGDDAANDALLRVNEGTTPYTLEICDNSNGGWVSVAAGAAAVAVWTQNTADEIHFNSAGTTEVGIGTIAPTSTLHVVGTQNTTGAVDFDSTLNVDGDSTLIGTLSVTGDTTVAVLNATDAVDFDSTLNVDGDSTLIGTLSVTGDTTVAVLNATGAVDFDSTLNVDGASTLSDTLITGSTADNTADALTVEDSAGADILVVQNDGFVGIKNATPTVELDIVGSINTTVNIDAGGDIDAAGNVEGTIIHATTDLTAAGDVIIQSEVKIGSDVLGPPQSCNSATEKLMWTNGGGGAAWTCVADIGAGGTAGGNTLAEVLTAGNSASNQDAEDFNRVGSDKYCNAGLSSCAGLNSVGLGLDITANGDSSIALGQEVNVTADNSMAIGLGNATGVAPKVSGAGSLGIFMGDQSGVVLTSANVMALMGGKFSIGTTTPAFGSMLEVVGGGKFIDNVSPLEATNVDGSKYVRTQFNNTDFIIHSDTGSMNINRFSNTSWHMFSDNANTAGMRVGNGSADFGRPGRVTIYGTTSDNTQASLVARNYAGDNLLYVLNDGDVGIGTNVPSASLKLDVEGQIGATEYCDEDGLNCFVATDVGSSSSANEINNLTDGAADGSSVFLGAGSGANDDGTANRNTGIGISALGNNTAGAFNTATGYHALRKNTTGAGNSAYGDGALTNSTTGATNTALGNAALRDNTTGASNTATGAQALRSNTSGGGNTATGVNALLKNTTGASNTAIGISSLNANLIGGGNTAIGRQALVSSIGDRNTAIGSSAGSLITTGSDNIMIGINIQATNPTSSNELNIGNILFGSGLGTTAGSKIGVANYCDENLANCFVATDVGGGGGGDAIVDADADTQIQVEESADEDKIRFDTAGTERMVIDETGNVGIGTSTPATALEVVGDVTVDGDIIFPDSGGAATYNMGSTGYNDLMALSLSRNSKITATANDMTYDTYDNQHFTNFQYSNSTGGTDVLTLGREWGPGSQYYFSLYDDQIRFTPKRYNTSNNPDLPTKPLAEFNVWNAAQLGLMIDGAASQTADLQQWRNSAETALSVVDASGYFGIGDASPDNGTGGQLMLDVEGPIGGTKFCDENGDNCFVATDVGGSSTIDGLSDAAHDAVNNNLFMAHEGGAVGATDDYNTGVGIAALDGLVGGVDGGLGNTAFGYQALTANTEGDYNVASGYRALYSNTTGDSNIAIGDNALYSNTGGTGNIAIGISTLYSNTTGNENFARGYLALNSNTTGNHNIASGHQAMRFNTTGTQNIAIGHSALLNNTIGSQNIAIGGYRTLYSNTGGTDNIASGHDTLISNTDGDHNIASGRFALRFNTTGDNNIVSGYAALHNNAIGDNNVAIGYEASGNAAAADGDMDGNALFGYRSGYNLAGGTAGLGANYNTLIGYQAGDLITLGDDNIMIGRDTDPPLATDSSRLNIGNTIYGDLATDKMGVANYCDENLANCFVATDVGGGGGGDAIVDADADTQIQVEESADEDKIRFDTAGTERMIIDETGNVGIGTAAPAQKLDITTASNSEGIGINGKLAISGFDTYLRLNQTGDFTSGIFTPGNLRVDGLLMIEGTRGLTNVTGNYGTVQTSGTGVGAWEGYSIDGEFVFMGNGTNTGIYNDIDNEWMVYATRNAGVELRYNGATKIVTTNTGVTITGDATATAHYNSSDERLKDNIETIGGLDIVSKLRGVSFDWKDGGKTSAGVIAQEIQKALPSAVKAREDGMLIVEYNQIIGPLIEATKELDAQNTNLKAQIDEMKMAQTNIQSSLASLDAQVELLNKVTGQKIDKASIIPTNTSHLALLILTLLSGLGLGIGIMIRQNSSQKAK